MNGRKSFSTVQHMTTLERAKDLLLCAYPVKRSILEEHGIVDVIKRIHRDLSNTIPECVKYDVLGITCVVLHRACILAYRRFLDMYKTSVTDEDLWTKYITHHTEIGNLSLDTTNLIFAFHYGTATISVHDMTTMVCELYSNRIMTDVWHETDVRKCLGCILYGSMYGIGDMTNLPRHCNHFVERIISDNYCTNLYHVLHMPNNHITDALTK